MLWASACFSVNTFSTSILADTNEHDAARFQSQTFEARFTDATHNSEATFQQLRCSLVICLGSFTN